MLRHNPANDLISRPREKKTQTPVVDSPPPTPPIPPYETRPKPTERKTVNKSGRRNMRRQAEAEAFPWNRNLDFAAAKANATWDDTIYDLATLNDMAATRAKNEKIIEKLDAEESERQSKS